MRKTESIFLHHHHHPLSASEPPPRPVRGAKHHRGTPEDPHPGLGDGSPRLPALPWGCIPRGVPGLCLPAARCRCPLLPALPPAAARGSRRGVGGAELPQFGKGRSGGPSKSGPGGVTQAQPPALRCLEGGCFCSFVSAPPRPRARVLWGAGRPREPRGSPSAWLGVGGGPCLAPPRSPPPPFSIFVRVGRGGGFPLPWERGILHASPQPSLAMWDCFAGKGGWYGCGKKSLGLALLEERRDSPSPKA